MNIHSLQSHLHIAELTRSTSVAAPPDATTDNPITRVDQVSISSAGEALAKIDGDADDTTGAVDTTGAGASTGGNGIERLSNKLQKDDPALFAALDANHDGKLDAQEMRAARTAFRDAVKDAVRAANADGASATDGGQQKFLDALSNALQKSNPAVFQALDKDGDGKLSATELRDGAQALLPHGHGHHHHDGDSTPVATAGAASAVTSPSSGTTADSSGVASTQAA